MDTNIEKGDKMKRIYRETAMQILQFAEKSLPSEGRVMGNLSRWIEDKCLAAVLRNIKS
jgi:hypothetical protein